MRIAIDMTPLHGRKWTGVELYAIDLYRALLKNGYDVVPIFNEVNEVDDNEKAFIIRNCNSRIILENLKLSQAVRKIKADITIFPIFPAPVDLYINRPTKIAPVIHDTAFVYYYNTLKFAAKYYLYPKTKMELKLADFIITISETSKKQLEKLTSLPVVNWGENIGREYQNTEQNIDVHLLNQFGLQPYSYYISVSTIEPRKNLKYLLRIIRKELDTSGKKLVLVGRKGWGKDKMLYQLIEEMSPLLVFTEYVPIETLQTLYHYASAFALMSLDEGFGRTPLEAIACGCKRIIVSDIEIFHESLGKSGNYIPLYKEQICSDSFIEGKWKEIDKNFSLPFDVMEHRIYMPNKNK